MTTVNFEKIENYLDTILSTVETSGENEFLGVMGLAGSTFAGIALTDKRLAVGTDLMIATGLFGGLSQAQDGLTSTDIANLSAGFLVSGATGALLNSSSATTALFGIARIAPIVSGPAGVAVGFAAGKTVDSWSDAIKEYMEENAGTTQTWTNEDGSSLTHNYERIGQKWINGEKMNLIHVEETWIDSDGKVEKSQFTMPIADADKGEFLGPRPEDLPALPQTNENPGSPNLGNDDGNENNDPTGGPEGTNILDYFGGSDSGSDTGSGTSDGDTSGSSTTSGGNSSAGGGSTGGTAPNPDTTSPNQGTSDTGTGSSPTTPSGSSGYNPSSSPGGISSPSFPSEGIGGGSIAPLILDLDEDGVEISFGQDIHFDIDGDGYLEQTAWVTGGDGFLVIDLKDDGTRGTTGDGIGVIDQGREIAFAAWTDADDTDLEALAIFDLNENTDGVADDVLNSEDAVWDELKVWVDANEDGITDVGELEILADLGITEINLGYDDGTAFSDTSNDVSVFENTLHGIASFTRYGSIVEGAVGDVSLAYQTNGYRRVDNGTGFAIEFETGEAALYRTMDGTGITDVSLVTDGLDGVTGDSRDNFLNGATHANDLLISGDGADDTLTGGNDTLWGGRGNDIISGGLGADELRGNDGDDILFFDEADTVVDGGAGRDAAIYTGAAALNIDLVAYNLEGLTAGAGDDTIYGNTSTEALTVNGDDGADVLFGGKADDAINGGSGNDTLNGQNGDDNLFSGDGDDHIFGEHGADFISAGSGADTIQGGWGNDYISGGDGADVIYGEEYAAFENASTQDEVAGSWWFTREKFVGDVNGDGKADIIALVGDDAQQHINVWHGQSNGQFTWGNQSTDGHAGSWWAGREKHVGDVNGDGRADLIMLTGADESSGIHVLFGQANGQLLWGNKTTDQLGGNWWSTREKHVGDVNGDGRSDIIAFTGHDQDQHINVWFGQDNGQFALSSQTADQLGGAWWSDREKMVGDVNGDGRSDIVAFTGEEDHSHINVWFGQDNGQFAFGGQTYSALAGSNWVGRDKYLVDIDADGYDDLVGYSNDSHQRIFTQKGSADGTFADVDATFFDLASDWWNNREQHIGDVNGDDLDDVIAFSGDGNQTITVRTLASGSDFISGGAGDDLIYGQAGDDIIRGGEGNDTLYGNSMWDRFVFSAGDGQDTIADYEDGIDRIEMAGLTFSDLSLSSNASLGEVYVGYGTGDQITIKVSDVSLIDQNDFDFV